MTWIAAIAPPAHIGNIPIEEWLPFLVPIVGLYFYGRRREQRRRGEVAELPATSEGLDPLVVQRIVEGWREGRYAGVTPDHLPLLYPPGPDGLSVAELLERTGGEEETLRGLLEQLERADYLDLFPEPQSGGLQASLTLRGFGLVDQTEESLLAALRERDEPSGGAEAPRLL
jgi:hypothetical protein